MAQCGSLLISGFASLPWWKFSVSVPMLLSFFVEIWQGFRQMVHIHVGAG